MSVNLSGCCTVAAPLFSEEQLSFLDPTRIPQHIAIIPDGNRRWAKQNAATTEEGHHTGADLILNIVKGGIALGVKTLTVFTFSTENWTRPQDEIDALMCLLEHYLIHEREPMRQNGVKLRTIGDLSVFPPYILEELEKTKAATANCDKINLVLALNYGGRDDIRRACQSILDNSKGQELKVTETMISKHLDTSNWPDPDLLIRTSGELRLSNFMLWQFSYAEIYTTKTFWPDFTPQHLFEAVLDFQNRERRLGGA